MRLCFADKSNTTHSISTYDRSRVGLYTPTHTMNWAECVGLVIENESAVFFASSLCKKNDKKVIWWKISVNFHPFARQNVAG